MLLWSIKEKSPNFFLCVDKMEFIYTKYPFNVIITHFFLRKKIVYPIFCTFFCFDLNLLTTRLQNILRGRRNLYCPNNKNPNLKWFPHIFRPRNIRVCNIAKSLGCHTWFLPLIPILTINVSPSTLPLLVGQWGPFWGHIVVRILNYIIFTILNHCHENIQNSRHFDKKSMAK